MDMELRFLDVIPDTYCDFTAGSRFGQAAPGFGAGGKGWQETQRGGKDPGREDREGKREGQGVPEKIEKEKPGPNGQPDDTDVEPEDKPGPGGGKGVEGQGGKGEEKWRKP